MVKKANTYFEQVPLAAVKKITGDQKEMPINGSKRSKKFKPSTTREAVEKLNTR